MPKQSPIYSLSRPTKKIKWEFFKTYIKLSFNKSKSKKNDVELQNGKINDTWVVYKNPCKH